jgi:thiosulfate sulfurtransferase
MKHKILLSVFFCCTLLHASGSSAVLGKLHFASDTTDRADSISIEKLQSLISQGSDIQIIDVRLIKDFDKAQVIPTAKWQDPGQVSQWAKSLDKSKPVVIYCVHGHKVSQQVVDQLRRSGYAAQRLEGGIEAWKEQKGPVTVMKN